MLKTILSDFGLQADECTITSFGTGLINNTWKVDTPAGQQFILQKINDRVFTDPAAIDRNMHRIAEFLQAKEPDYFFVRSVKDEKERTLLSVPGQGHFRMLPFVNQSYTYDTVESPETAFEAASQFGTFARVLSQMPAEELSVTLPEFHNLSLRYQQFEESLISGNIVRITEAQDVIDFLTSQHSIVKTYESIVKDPSFKKRPTHHDTKISNVLFDKTGKGICVIDLDTTMPGFFLSDVGDMMRTYLSPVSEEEQDVSKIQIRDGYFEAIATGYLQQMKPELSSAERNHFVYAGNFLIYMQALRFLTDHLNNDKYYGAKYVNHNLFRAKNQIRLLQCYTEKAADFENIVHRVLSQAPR